MRKVKNFISKRVNANSIVWPMARVASTALFQYRYLRFQKFGNPLNNFHELYIEPVSYCNLRCRFCALEHSKPKHRFDLVVFEELLNELLTDRRLTALQWIHLHNGGESTLHPQLDEMLYLIDEAKKKAVKLNKSFAKVSLLSNGTVYRPKLADALKTTQAVDLLRFSMDGGSPEMYEYIRNRAHWKTFRETVLSYMQAARLSQRSPQVEFITLLDKNQLPQTVLHNKEFAELLQLADDYEVRFAHDWGGQLIQDFTPVPNPLPLHKRGCRLLLHSLVLLADGHATVCCADLNGKGIIGKYPDFSLAGLYLSAKRMWMLDKIAKGRNAEVPLCAKCEGF
ncbi:hypothetical protein JCM31826_09630 [Thermaurantimonas aggregans]|uniref:Radical SAM core domain-containing protein n=1 Tax=Thermaurantimonas aggregans TaxID=2173829 RepID=A0A401XKI7_9FLAO|nr:radical SAM protein [Thermaurantimonas aggregans]GCD77481.1 hypothetical protein JCM31826_09630 [Thermaurantimonas aggregans]